MRLEFSSILQALICVVVTSIAINAAGTLVVGAEVYGT